MFGVEGVEDTFERLQNSLIRHAEHSHLGRCVRLLPAPYIQTYTYICINIHIHICIQVHIYIDTYMITYEYICVRLHANVACWRAIRKGGRHCTTARCGVYP